MWIKYIVRTFDVRTVYIMQSKEYYRERLLDFKPYVNISAVAKAVGISRNALVMFMKGSEFNYALSVETAEKVVRFLENI